MLKRIQAAVLGLTVLGLIGCDSDMLHQDRPGGSDYNAARSGTSSRGGWDRGGDYGQSGASRERDYCGQSPGACRGDTGPYRNRRPD
jgi:hypothetical protein